MSVDEKHYRKKHSHPWPSDNKIDRINIELGCDIIPKPQNLELYLAAADLYVGLQTTIDRISADLVEEINKQTDSLVYNSMHYNFEPYFNRAMNTKSKRK
jgi:hypothetical protein